MVGITKQTVSPLGARRSAEGGGEATRRRAASRLDWTLSSPEPVPTPIENADRLAEAIEIELRNRASDLRLTSPDAHRRSIRESLVAAQLL